MSDARMHAPAAARNRDAILDVLRRLAPPQGVLLEIASGTGEHAAHFAAALRHLIIQPSDADAERRASIDAWCAGLANVLPAATLDASAPDWPVARADLVFCANMIHIAPWNAAEGLLAGAGRLLGRAASGSGGVLLLYGPFRRAGAHTSASNAAFDADLRARNPAWGVRDLEAIECLAHQAGFGTAEITAMPANNLCVAFRRGATG